MITCNAKILCKVDNLYILRNLMFLQKLLTLTVTKTEENDIDLVEWHLCRKVQIGFSAYWRPSVPQSE